MIPPNIARIVFIVLAVLTVAFGLLAVKSCRDAQTAKTAAKLATGQADAALKSGTDAVNTLGNQIANEAAGDRLTQENENAIDHATGSDAAVHSDARAAGMHALCGRSSYRASHPECVQQPSSR